LYSDVPPRLRPSFPTRRSSDLDRCGLPAMRYAASVHADAADRVCTGDRHGFVLVGPRAARRDRADQLTLAIDGHAAAEGYRVLRSEEHTSELQSRENLVCRLLL